MTIWCSERARNDNTAFLRLKTCAILRSSKGSRLAIENFNGIVQARQFKDVLVMVAESVGEHSLFLAIDTDEQGDDQPDAATIHIF